MIKKFIVTLDIPKGVSVEEMASYIHGEVSSGIGRYSSEDPIWHLDKGSIQVRPFGRLSQTISTGDQP